MYHAHILDPVSEPGRRRVHMVLLQPRSPAALYKQRRLIRQPTYTVLRSDQCPPDLKLGTLTVFQLAEAQ